MEAKNTEKTPPMSTLIGGVTETVIVLDEGKPVAVEVEVRQLAIKDYPQLLEAQGNEIAQLQLYCGRPKEWVERLTPDSHEKLITVAEELNGDFFGRWLSRQMGRLERIRPGLGEKLFTQGTLAPAETSPSSPPKLRPIAGLPGSKLESAVSPG